MPSGNLAVSPPSGFNEMDVERAQKLHEKLCGLVGAGRQLSYLIAEALYEIKRCEYYTLLGYNSFQEYAESPEIAIGKSQAYKLISIYECYVVELGNKPEDLDAVPDLDRIGMVVPLIRALKESNAPDADERIAGLIEDAKVLSRRDLLERKREELGISRPGETREDDILAEFVGWSLAAQERRIEVDGSVKVVLTFERENERCRVVFYATGKDVGINVEKAKHGLDRKDAGREARL
jgi:hypothetical protein